MYNELTCFRLDSLQINFICNATEIYVLYGTQFSINKLRYTYLLNVIKLRIKGFIIHQECYSYVN